MVQQMRLKITRSEKTNQTVLVTRSKQNKWGLGKLKNEMHSPQSGLKPTTFCLVAWCLKHYVFPSWILLNDCQQQRQLYKGL
jgi:hypothetical protein